MSKAQELDRAQELRKNIDTMDACVAAGKNWPFVISTGAIRHVLDELDAARAALSASSEQQAAQQDAPDLLPRMGIRNDRDMLNYLMRAFDSEVNYCVRCGCEEETKDMDSANFLREYLASARASNGGKA